MKAFVSLADILGLHLLFQAKRSSSGVLLPSDEGTSYKKRLTDFWITQF